MDIDDIMFGIGFGMLIWMFLYLFTGMFYLTVYGLSGKSIPFSFLIHVLYLWIWLFSSLLVLLKISMEDSK